MKTNLLRAVLLTIAVSTTVFGQAYNISTFAGGGLPVNVPGTFGSLYGPLAVTADQAGNLFFVDQNDVLRLDASTGVLTLIAGNGTQGFSGDNGPASNAQLNHPQGIALDNAGNLYIADSNNNRIRRVAGGVIVTVAGNGIAGFSGDGAAAINAQLNQPAGVTVDANGNLFIADTTNQYIREVSGGVINSVAGSGVAGFFGDSSFASSAQLNYPSSVAVDSSGNLYIADRLNSRIRKVASGIITTVAGIGTPGFNGDNGAAATAAISLPQSIVADSAGNLYIADTGNNRVRKITNGAISTLAGTGTAGFTGDGIAAAGSQLNSPAGAGIDSAGNVYIADTGNSRLRKISGGAITTVAGNGTQGFSGDNGPATSAELNGTVGVAVDTARNLYISDSNNQRVRKVSSGVISTVVGNGTAGFSGDNGPATAAQLHNPSGVTVDASGNLYVADTANQRVRKIVGGTITTVAGSGAQGFAGDNGQAVLASLNNPQGVAVDGVPNLYIADFNNNGVREVSNGTISSFAGYNSQGYSGDGGSSFNAQLNFPRGVATDNNGNIYVADTYNNVIRKIAHGVITTVAGNGTPGFSGDGGQATSAQLSLPQGVAIDAAGILYIADTQNARIRKVVNGVISTIAGNGTQGFNGDNGPATSAALSAPSGVALDSLGNVYVADTNNNRVRILSPLGSSCSYTVAPNALQISAAGGNLTVSIQTSASCVWTVSGLPSWIAISNSPGVGSGSITLKIPANSGAALSATLTIAGQAITVTQAAAGGCNYAISPGGQTFTSAGGSGTINITASPGCSWSATTATPWIITNTPTSGSGNGTVTYLAVTNSGAAQAGTITVAGLPFTVEEGAVSVSGFTTTGSMAQLASAGAWTTTITLINTGTTPAQARLNFFGDNGSALSLPWTFPSSGQVSNNVVELASTFDRTLAPGAEFVVQTTGPASQAVTTGWTQILTSGGISGYAVFGAAIGSTVQEAVAPIETRNSTGYVIAYDNTNGNAAGIAMANLTTQALAVTVTVRDNTGAPLLTDTLGLPATGHTSFVLTSRYGSVAAGRLGTVELKTTQPGQISALGIRGNATGAFSNIPAAAE